jgi:hypothetical protein
VNVYMSCLLFAQPCCTLTCPPLTGQQAPDTEPCLPCSCASTRPHLSMLNALHMFACQLTLCVRRYLLKKAGHWWLLVTLGGIMDWCPRLSLVDSLWSGLTGPFATIHTHTHTVLRAKRTKSAARSMVLVGLCPNWLHMEGVKRCKRPLHGNLKAAFVPCDHPAPAITSRCPPLPAITSRCPPPTHPHKHTACAGTCRSIQVTSVLPVFFPPPPSAHPLGPPTPPTPNKHISNHTTPVSHAHQAHTPAPPPPTHTCHAAPCAVLLLPMPPACA